MLSPQALEKLGRYKNISLIGEGATATVFAAQNIKTGADVAVKVLHPALAADKVSLERFRREVLIARKLNHPGIVPVYDLFRQNGHVCIEMELLKGRTLKDLLLDQGKLEIDQAVSILTDLASILSHCHKNNVIHRDIKPQNVFLGDDGRLRLLDFGISKMTLQSDLTKTGVTLGTPEYMAPELFADCGHDPRSDLYALGVIAFEMLCGHPPFQGDTIAVLFFQHIHTPVPQVSAERPETPPWLSRAIAQLLEKQPIARYQCVEELLLDLKRHEVSISRLPALNKTQCLRCGEQTLSRLPFCLFCGLSFSSNERKGAFRVVRDVEYRNFRVRHEDKEALRSFVQDTFHIEANHLPAHRSVLLSGVDKLFAELVKREGMRHNILFSVQPVSAARDLSRELMRFLLLIPAFALFGLIYSFFMNMVFYRTQSTSYLSVYMLLFYACSVLVVLLASAWLGLLMVRNNPKPALDISAVLPTPFYEDLQWFEVICQKLGKERNDEMRQTVAHVVEQFLLLRGQEATRAGSPLDDATVRGLITMLVDMANLATEVDKAIKQAAQSLPLQNATQASVESMEEIVALESFMNRRDSLMNRFLRLRGFFNQLCVQSVVQRQALRADRLEQFISQMKDIEKEFRVLSETRRELAAL